MPINLSVEYPKLEAENQKLKRLLHDLTPGGSEFYNDPERCFKWVKEAWLEEKKSFTKIISDLKKDNERLASSHKSAMLVAMEFGYKQCEKGENIQAAFLNYNKIINP
jgi:hypothetical protein